MRDVTLKQLRIVAAIARSGRVVSAADSLSVTPPAVTLQLKLLEQQLGLAVFERGRQGMVLTAAGQRMLEAAQRIDAVLRETEQHLGALRGVRSGSVTVGVVSTAKYFAPAALGAFRKLHPETDIRLAVSNREDMVRSLAAMEFDLVIMGLPPEGVAVEAVVIGDHPHVIVAAPDHRLARRQRIPLEALAKEAFLVREPGSGTRGLMQRLFDEARIAPPIAMEMSSNETIKQAVMAGLGIAFISGHTIATEVEGGRLAVLDVVGLPALRRWQVVRHAEKRLTAASSALWEFLAREGRLFLPPLLRGARVA